MNIEEFVSIIHESIYELEKEYIPYDVTSDEMKDLFWKILNQKLDKEKIANALRKECSSYCLDNEGELQKVAEILSSYRW